MMFDIYLELGGKEFVDLGIIGEVFSKIFICNIFGGRLWVL